MPELLFALNVSFKLKQTGTSGTADVENVTADPEALRSVEQVPGSPAENVKVRLEAL